MKRKLLSSILIFSILTATIAFSVNAAELTPANPTGNSPLKMTTSTISQPIYTITIPEKIEFGNLVKSKEDNIISKSLTVTASGVSNLFANQKKLVVTASSMNVFELKDAGAKSSLPYKMYGNDINTPLANNGTILEVIGNDNDDENLTVTINGQAQLNAKNVIKAGNYTDILTFSVALQEVN